MIRLAPDDRRLRALGSRALRPILLLDFGTSPERHVSDAAGAVEAGGIRYLPDAALYSATTPDDDDSDMPRDLYQVTFAEADPAASSSWATLFAGGGIGVRFRARLVFGGAGKRVTAPLHVHRGRCVAAERIVLDGDADESALLVGLRLTFGGPFAQLDARRTVTASPERQRALHPGDTSLDHIHRTARLVSGRAWSG